MEKQVVFAADTDFDMDFQSVSISSINDTTHVTSKSLCTPGCGNTGTGNSFCCR